MSRSFDLLYDESICKLYGDSSYGCKQRIPRAALPFHACCNDCAKENCERRCLNTKDKCGQAVPARTIHYKATDIEDEFQKEDKSCSKQCKAFWPFLSPLCLE